MVSTVRSSFDGAADQPGKLVHDHISGMVLRAAPIALRARRRLRHRRLDVGVANEALVAHRLQHELGTSFGSGGIAGGRQLRRRLDKAGKHRRLAEIDVAGRFVEVALRRRLDAISVRAEVDAIQVHRQDLILGELVLQPDGEQHFLHLALQRALRRQEEVLGELLRQRRATLDGMAGQHVRHYRTAEADRIEAEMRIEAAVLDGDDRLGNIGRHIVQRQSFAAGRTTIGDDAAVEIGDLDIRWPVGDGPGAGVRHARSIVDHEAGSADACPDAEHDAPIDHRADETEETATTLAARPLAPAAGTAWFVRHRIIAAASRRAPAAGNSLASAETIIAAFLTA